MESGAPCEISRPLFETKPLPAALHRLRVQLPQH
jgi:hypothetical protein